MKGIVVEIRNKDAVILSDKGDVIKVKNNNFQIGEEIQMKNNKKSKGKFIALAAGFIIAFTAAGGAAYAYTTPYSYVSLDVNPSVEYSVNVFHRVIKVDGVNDDGKNIINNINVKHKTIDEAIKDTVSEISNEGYIKDGEIGGIVISTSSNNDVKSQELADKLKSDAEEVINDKKLVADVEAISVGKERVEEAKKLGVTPGKLNLVEKLKESAANSENISIEEWLNKPVKEIMKATKANKEEQKAKPEATINSNKDQSEATDAKEKVEKEAKDTNGDKNNNINENKDTNAVSAEKKTTNTTLDENKSQGNQSNPETSNKKAK